MIPLPNAYVVPGGRFREVYYWDSYFTMLGLIQAAGSTWSKNMLDSFAYLVRTVGHVPNGNRSYYLGRSQPPYFAAMVGLYATATGSRHALRYRRGARGRARVLDGGHRPARAGTRPTAASCGCATGAVLNRYWDDMPGAAPGVLPRGLRRSAHGLPDAAREELYRNIRAAAESGWDFSSRWMRDPNDLRTLETTALVPVDLNSLLYQAERTIAMLRRARGRATMRWWHGDSSARPRNGADAARRGVRSLDGFFYDVRWATGEQVTDRPTLAAAAPLYFGLATRGAGPRGCGAARARLPVARRVRDHHARHRDSSGTRPMAGRPCSGSAIKAAPLWPRRHRRTRRATAGSRSSGGRMPRRGR